MDEQSSFWHGFQENSPNANALLSIRYPKNIIMVLDWAWGWFLFAEKFEYSIGRSRFHMQDWNVSVTLKSAIKYKNIPCGCFGTLIAPLRTIFRDVEFTLPNVAIFPRLVSTNSDDIFGDLAFPWATYFYDEGSLDEGHTMWPKIVGKNVLQGWIHQTGMNRAPA